MSKILKNRTTNNGEFFKFITLPFPTFRCAVVISKKVMKRRVDRNRQKRRILHAIKTFVPQDKSIALVVWVKKDTSSLSSFELQEQLSQILN